MTIQKKLYLCYGSLLCLVLGMGCTSIFLFGSLLDLTRSVGERHAGQLYAAGVLNGSTSESIIAEVNLLGDAATGDKAAIEADAAHYVESGELTRRSLEAIRSQSMDLKTAGLVTGLMSALDQTAPLYQQFLAAVSAGARQQALVIHTGQLRASLKNIDNGGEGLMKAQREDMEAATAQAEKQVAWGRLWMMAFVLTGVAVGAALIVVILRLGRQLQSSVAELAESYEQIAAAAGQVSSTSQALAEGASRQAATIEETSSASTEINSMARRTTDSSRSTAEIVTRSQDSFTRTNASLAELTSAMEGIHGSSQKISKIIKVIDEIAFQTNILALNAAVEAARAGEAGAGFAVVADEVRGLAQRCTQAAKDTTALIEESIESSNSGKTRTEQVGASIRAVAAESSEIKVLVDEIQVGSVEQSRGIEAISQSIAQLEQATQSNAASAEQGAAAAQELNAQAETMRDVVSRLRNMVEHDTPAGADRNAISRQALATA